ncbi:hypothetical protein BS47DRAFT_1347073 [Hydnum rufescens UP504]|uniref:Uncharacterized protein n=1 Tax=Hydnum rufescens UP504 TaxID=1448309 RepID=A0A9P6DU25_9AGAM|nr:hypothetical protein BS47DRAFT_1347073 [Hydnum rufescens UP504]
MEWSTVMRAQRNATEIFKHRETMGSMEASRKWSRKSRKPGKLGINALAEKGHPDQPPPTKAKPNPAGHDSGTCRSWASNKGAMPHNIAYSMLSAALTKAHMHSCIEPRVERRIMECRSRANTLVQFAQLLHTYTRKTVDELVKCWQTRVRICEFRMNLQTL